jgi:hypothetical protein
MRLDRLLSQHQAFRDTLIRQALGDEGEHFALATGEIRERLSAASLGKQLAHDFRVDHRAARRNTMDCREKPRGFGDTVLQQVPEALRRLGDQRGRVSGLDVVGENEHRQTWVRLAQCGRGAPRRCNRRQAFMTAPDTDPVALRAVDSLAILP